MYSQAYDFIKQCRDKSMELHAFSLLCDGREAMTICPPPYRVDDRIQLYSLSKSFTSLAFGTLVDAGLVSVNDEVLGVFPEYAVYVTDERKKHVTFENLLTMSSGHGCCVMEKIYADNSDPLRVFFSEPLFRDPGSAFTYSTSATFVVAAAVERITGRSLSDYLGEKLFAPLSIAPVKWDTICGLSTGGVGLYQSCEDLTKFAKLLYNGGVYDGKRIISSEYLSRASTKRISNDGNGTPDWCAGYGYQMWVNHGGGFRCDGAYGQLCVVLPEKKRAFVLLGEIANMQEEISVARDFALSFTPEYDGMDEAEFNEKLAELYKAPRSGESVSIDEVYNNDLYGEVSVKCDGEKLELSFGGEKLLAGRGEYVFSEPLLHRAVPVIWQLPNDEWRKLCVRSAFDVVNGEIKIVCRSTDTPHTIDVTVKASTDRLEVAFRPRLGNISPDAALIIAAKG